MVLKIQVKFLNKLKSKGFLASSFSTYDFYTLYTALPHNLIKEKLTELDLLEQNFQRESSCYSACSDITRHFTSEKQLQFHLNVYN